MTARTHEEIMKALEACIQFRLAHKPNNKFRYTLSYFPDDARWVLHHAYKRYTWGVFYDHRFYGLMLTTHWQQVMVINEAQKWDEKKVYLDAKKREATGL